MPRRPSSSGVTSMAEVQSAPNSQNVIDTPGEMH